MKHLILTLALLTCSLVAVAQKGISYQAVILDPNPIEIPGKNISGQPFVNGDVSLKFKIYSSTFVQEFEEVHVTKTDGYGLVNVLIGSVSPAAFASLGWDSNAKNLQVWVSFDQGGTYKKVSEQVLTYNPYAIYAETAGKLSGTLGIAAGGTGATTAAAARTNLGLGNVDNTSDANKPISIATQLALDAKTNVLTNYVNNQLAAATIADADAATKGKIQLAGDLAGTAAAPTVPSLALKADAAAVNTALGLKANASDVAASLAFKEDASNKANTPLGSSTTLFPTQNAVKTYVDTQVAGATIADASASTKGKIQLAGDLAGTASAPTVPSLALKANASDVTASLNLKANAADVTTALNLKSPLASPSFTGTVAIGTTNPSPSAVLDLTSTSKGLLLPRLTFAQKSAIVSPEPGLIFWCTDCGTSGEMQVYNGTAFVNMIGSPAQLAMPAISSTTGMSSITSSTASSGGVISSDGGAAITARGVVWGTSTNPTIVLPTKTTDGTGTGTFTSSLTGLTSGVTYYVRSYATNSVGTKYGPEITFNSLQSAPTLAATTAASSISATTATSGGTISYNGGSTVTASGIVWGTTANPTTENSTKTTDGTLNGTYTSAISGLTPGTLYFVRSYATNALGTNYGAQISFTTLTMPTLAATTAASSITPTTAISGGNISSDGGSAVTARGIVWGTSTNPTTDLTTKTTDGTGTDTFASSLTGLSPTTTYYVRSYATNAVGTVYGTEISFTTLAVAPTQAAITTEPSGAVNGVALTTQPVVRITDSSGNIATTSTVSVVASIASGTGTLSGTTTIAAVNGVATFTDLVLSGATGNFTLAFTPTSLAAATSSSFALSVGAATQAAITTQPAGAAAGTAFTTQPVIRITDASGNTVTSSTVNVVASIASGTGTLSGTTTVAAVNGIATFTNLVLSGATGNFTLAFTPTSLAAATSSSFALGVGTASKAMITAQPSGAVNGVALTTQPVIRVTDASGNTVTSSTVNVVASIASGTGTLSGTTTVAAVNGIATFTDLVLSGTAGNFTLVFTPTSLTAATSRSFALSFGAATQAAITTQPSGAAAGVAFTTPPVIRITDASGNTVTSSTVNVVASIASGTGTLSGTTTIAAVNGVATFTNLSISGSGSHTLTFTPTSLTAATSSSFVLGVGSASKAMMTTQPSGAVNGVTLTTQPVVRITDASGNTDTSSTVNVVASIASGTGTLSGTTTVAAVNGIATFTDLVLSGTAGNFTLVFTPTSLTAATSSSFALSFGAATQAAITTEPSGAAAGTAFTTQPVVRITDSSGNTVTTSTVNVVASIASGTGTISGTTTVAAVNGIATFTDLVLSGATGNFTLTFTPTSLTAATSNNVALTAGAASQALITTQPAGAAAGTAFTTQPVIRITDASGNTVTSSTVNVVASIASGTGTLSGTTTVAAVNGIATFTDLVLSGATGNFTLTFTPTSLTAATSSSFALGVGSASKAMITTQPSGAVNGVALTTQPVIRVTDASGNTVTSSTVNVVASIASGTGTLSGTTTVAAVNGIATFTDLVLSGTAGNFTLTFTPTSLTAATSSSFALSVGAATQAAITTEPSGAAAGASFTTQPVVRITDSSGNTVTTSTASVVASIASGTGTLSGTTTVAAINGVATFTNLSISGSGSHTLTFTSTSLTAATTSSFALSVGAATQAAITTEPSGAAAGTAFTTQPVVRITDSSGNTVTTSTVNVVASIASGTGTLSGTTTVAAVNGVATFTNLVLSGATGNFTLAFTPTSLTAATSSNFALGVGTASKAMITAQPSGAVNGVALTTQPVIRITDASGNTVTSSTVNVVASIASGTGTLSGTTTVAAVNGIATFTDLVLSGTAGNFTLVFTPTSLTAATSSSFALSFGAATQAAITTQPSGAAAGVAFTTQPVIRITDASGNTVTSSTVNVVASIASGTGTLSGTTTVAAVNGVATFTNLVLSGATGNFTLAFTPTSLTAATSNSFALSFGAATQAAITTEPSGAAAGTAFTTQPVIRITDASGNTVTSSTVNVVASIASGTGTLSGTTTVAAVNGVATFTNLVLSGATGNFTLAFTPTSLTAATSISFALSFGTASKAMISTQPSGAAAGTAFTTQPVVRITDSSGNTVTTSTVNVVASIASGTGTLSGTTTVAAVNGVATFTNLVLSGATGNFTLTFTPTSLTAATSSSFALGVGTASKAMITAQPAGAVNGVALTTQPVIRVTDASGNTVTSSTVNVVASIASGTGTLSGTTTVAAVNGVATFTDLVLSGTAGNFTLVFTPTSLTAATSSSFALSFGTASKAMITTEPSGAAAGTAFTTQPVIRVTDASGNTVTSSTVNVVASIASGTGTLSGTTTVAAVNGVATFTNLVLSGATGNFTLAFTPTSLTAATSNSFALSFGTASKAMITTEPSGAVNGVALTTQPVIRITDASGNTVTSSTVNVVASIASGTGGTLSGTTTVAAVNGVATFTNLVLSGTPGNFTLTFTPTSLTAATSSSFALSVGAASKVMVTTQPSGAFTGTAFSTQPVVRITDAGGNTITSSTANVVASIASGAGTLSGTTTVAAVNGVATFTNLKITGTGNHTLTFTAAGGLTAATSNTVNVAQLGCAQGGNCAIGETGPGGGTVFYYSAAGFSCGPDFTSTCYYLEVAPKTWYGSTTEPALRWDPNGGDDVHANIPNNADPHLLTSEIGLGYKNSVQLFNFYGNNDDYAAGAARRYAGGGKSDWYLGSAAEMNLLAYWSKGKTAPPLGISSGAMTQGNFENSSGAAYWTSSEGITSEYFDARKQTFGTTASPGPDHKSFQRFVRPIRAF